MMGFWYQCHGAKIMFAFPKSNIQCAVFTVDVTMIWNEENKFWNEHLFSINKTWLSIKGFECSNIMFAGRKCIFRYDSYTRYDFLNLLYFSFLNMTHCLHLHLWDVHICGFLSVHSGGDSLMLDFLTVNTSLVVSLWPDHQRPSCLKGNK